MCTHTGEDPKIYPIQTQNQAKQDDWPKETQKKCPIKVIQTTILSPWAHLHVCLHVPFFLLINTLLVSLLSLCANSFPHSWQARALSLATGPGGLVARIQQSPCRGLTSNPGREPCFKPLHPKPPKSRHRPVVPSHPSIYSFCKYLSKVFSVKF